MLSNKQMKRALELCYRFSKRENPDVLINFLIQKGYTLHEAGNIATVYLFS